MEICNQEMEQDTCLEIEIVKHKFPYVKHISLDDASSVPCDDDTDQLAQTYIASHGKTWYEAHFHAYIADKEVMQLYHDRIKAFTLPLTGKTFESIFGNFIIKHPDTFEQLRHFYDKSNTLLDFFRTAYTELKKKEYCDLVGPWLNLFIDRMLGGIIWVNSTWLIDVSSFSNNLDISFEPNTPQYLFGGGKKKKRRCVGGGLSWEDLWL